MSFLFADFTSSLPSSFPFILSVSLCRPCAAAAAAGVACLPACVPAAGGCLCASASQCQLAHHTQPLSDSLRSLLCLPALVPHTHPGTPPTSSLFSLSTLEAIVTPLKRSSVSAFLTAAFPFPLHQLTNHLQSTPKHSYKLAFPCQPSPPADQDTPPFFFTTLNNPPCT